MADAVCVVWCENVFQAAPSISLMNAQVLWGNSFSEAGAIIKDWWYSQAGKEGQPLYCLSPIITEKTQQTSFAPRAVKSGKGCSV